MLSSRSLMGYVALLICCATTTVADPKTAVYAEIRLLDDATGHGVPLVELITVNQLRFVTDNAGRVAFHEPDLMDREVFFTIRSHGYEIKTDGFGSAGVKITPKAGQRTEIKIARKNIAERLCRLTGEGKYRDTLLLGYKAPFEQSAHPGGVAGQDSVQAVPYKGDIYWFWGDTNRMSYPLGMYRTSGAKTPAIPITANLSQGIAFDYFTDRTGFARAMMPLRERAEGVIWIDGVCTAPDEKGVEKMVAHYSRRKGLGPEFEHGIAVFDDERNQFVVARELPLTEKWRFVRGHPEKYRENGNTWLLCGNPALAVRVPATLKDVLEPKNYEAFTCAAAMDKGKPSSIKVDNDGVPIWRWQSDFPPMGSETEETLVKTGKMKPEQTRFYPANRADSEERIRLHNGTIRWNEHRKRWILIAGQIGGKSSFLGEIWYAETDEPTGPFRTAVKIVTHNKQSFYNVCHHPFLDRGEGRFIHFEGTYTSDFSGNTDKTPRYEYNQILYRLDLDSPALAAR